MARLSFVWFLLTVFGTLGYAQQEQAARAETALGVQAFREAQYQKAIQHFQKAVSLDPAFTNARLYLASAYMSRYIPGNEAPENVRFAETALAEFGRVLELAPEHEIAMQSIGSLYYNLKKFDDAKEWYEKLAAVRPEKKEAPYTLGVIAWTQSYQRLSEARAKIGMAPEEPGPLKDEKIRSDLSAKVMPLVREGMASLEKALQIDPEYDDAMAYLNLLYRSKADLEESPEASRRDESLANEWMRKALDLKKRKIERHKNAGTEPRP